MPRPAMSFALTGDSVITRRNTRTSIPGVRRLIEQIRATDIAFTNLAVLPNDYRCYPVQDSGGDHMAGPPWVVDELAELGFDLFATATKATPAKLVRQRSDDDSTGFAADQRYWQTIVAICHFDDGQLARIDLHPVSLGFGLPLHQHGKPSLATGDEAGAILERSAVLSKPFGVTIEVEEHQCRVQLG